MNVICLSYFAICVVYMIYKSIYYMEISNVGAFLKIDFGIHLED